MVAPYQTKPGYLYIPCKRGDGIIAPNKPEQMRLRNGMCGGAIVPEDWKTPPVLSPYTQGETLWIEVPQTTVLKKLCEDAGRPLYDEDGKVPSKKYRPMKHWIDFSQLPAHVPDFLQNVYEHKKQIPVMKLNSLPSAAIRHSSELKITDKLIADVGQITQGNYTVGPAAGDNYPTFLGAGGGWAALGNLTGDLTFTLTGTITEAANGITNVALNNFTLRNTSNSPNNGNPTAGWIVQCNVAGTSMFNVRVSGGNFIIEKMLIRDVAAANANTILVYVTLNAAATNVYLNDLLLDCAGTAGRAMRVNDADVTLYAYNCVVWDSNTSDNILLQTIGANSVLENVASYLSDANGFNVNNNAITLRNCTAYGNTNDFANIGAATGRFNRSSDLTAANANWAAGAGNTTGAVVAADVQGVNDAAANFFDIIAGGPLDGAGEANTIALRTTCIRNRIVPGPNGTSVGPAEVPFPDTRNIARLHGSHIAIHRMGTGIY